jgi:Family of unknown function (DUF5677)
VDFQACGIALLGASKAFDRLGVAPEAGRETLAILGLVGRCRRLVRAAYELADRAMDLEAQILIRVLLEYGITVRWLVVNPHLHFRQWAIADIEKRFTIDREIQEFGEETVLTEESRAQFERRLEDFRRECGAASTKLPPLQERARQTGESLSYSMAYRYDSQSGAHPTPLAAEALVSLDPEGRGSLITAEPTDWMALNVYAAGAFMLLDVLDAAGALPELALGPELQPIRERLEELSQAEPQLPAKAD